MIYETGRLCQNAFPAQAAPPLDLRSLVGPPSRRAIIRKKMPCHGHNCCAAASFELEIPEHLLDGLTAANYADDAHDGNPLSPNPTASARPSFPKPNLKPEIVAEVATMSNIRRMLHSWPEMGFEEVKTAAFVEEQLRKLPGVELVTKLGVTGVLGIYRGTKPGPTIAFRADMVGFGGFVDDLGRATKS